MYKFLRIRGLKLSTPVRLQGPQLPGAVFTRQSTVNTSTSSRGTMRGAVLLIVLPLIERQL